MSEQTVTKYPLAQAGVNRALAEFAGLGPDEVLDLARSSLSHQISDLRRRHAVSGETEDEQTAATLRQLSDHSTNLMRQQRDPALPEIFPKVGEVLRLLVQLEVNNADRALSHYERIAGEVFSDDVSDPSLTASLDQIATLLDEVLAGNLPRPELKESLVAASQTTKSLKLDIERCRERQERLDEELETVIPSSAFRERINAAKRRMADAVHERRALADQHLQRLREIAIPNPERERPLIHELRGKTLLVRDVGQELALGLYSPDNGKRFTLWERAIELEEEQLEIAQGQFETGEIESDEHAMIKARHEQRIALLRTVVSRLESLDLQDAFLVSEEGDLEIDPDFGSEVSPQLREGERLFLALNIPGEDTDEGIRDFLRKVGLALEDEFIEIPEAVFEDPFSSLGLTVLGAYVSGERFAINDIAETDFWEICPFMDLEVRPGAFLFSRVIGDDGKASYRLLGQLDSIMDEDDDELIGEDELGEEDL